MYFQAIFLHRHQIPRVLCITSSITNIILTHNTEIQKYI